jgi:hypothetical protein
MNFDILYPHTLAEYIKILAARLPAKLKGLNLYFYIFLFLISLQTTLAESQKREEIKSRVDSSKGTAMNF